MEASRVLLACGVVFFHLVPSILGALEVGLLQSSASWAIDLTKFPLASIVSSGLCPKENDSCMYLVRGCGRNKKGRPTSPMSKGIAVLWSDLGAPFREVVLVQCFNVEFWTGEIWSLCFHRVLNGSLLKPFKHSRNTTSRSDYANTIQGEDKQWVCGFFVHPIFLYREKQRENHHFGGPPKTDIPNRSKALKNVLW